MSSLCRFLEWLDARWRLPARIFGWTIILGTSASAMLYMTVPLPFWILPGGASSTPPLAVITPASASSHMPMPDEVRGFYMTAYSAASKELRSGLFAYAKRNHLNAVVIDVKDGNGRLAFMPESKALKTSTPEKATMPDLDAVLREARESDLYRIARVFVFQDPDYVSRFPDEAVQKKGGGVWADYKGVTWVDAASRAAWRYNVDLAKEAYARGFDEIQFDYIRFPSDGDMKSIDYVHYDGVTPKHEVIADFFRFMHEQLEVNAGIPISYDLFGYVTWYVDFDLGIGQLLVDALPNATAVSAMMYPSHYGNGTLGFANPADHPYEIVADSLKKANKLYAQREKECGQLAAGTKSATSSFLLPCDGVLARHRPWIQAFDIGAVYDATKIRAQIQATRDEDAKGYLLWNARNVYRDFHTIEAIVSASATP